VAKHRCYKCYFDLVKQEHPIQPTEFTLGGVFARVADVVPERAAVVQGARRVSYFELAERTRRLASYLHSRGLGLHVERADLAGHESGQDHLALLLYNGPEYIEGMLGAYGARVAPFNVNYRYTGDELRFIFADAKPRGVLFHSSLAPVLGPVLDEMESIAVLLQIQDGFGNDLIPGAVDYELALASADPAGPPVSPSADDLYILYTGGTTGMPKGVLWRQHDVFMAAMGGRVIGSWEPLRDYDQIQKGAIENAGMSVLLIPPLMHGGAQWGAFHLFRDGNTIVMPEDTRRMDPADVWATVAREGVVSISVIGDAVVRPLLRELELGTYDTSSLAVIANGAAPLTPAVRLELLERFPNLIITDTVGSSETGAQMNFASNQAEGSMIFTPGPGVVILNDQRAEVVQVGHDSTGWLGQSGWMPLGYLGDAEKTDGTFPVVQGIRYAIPGDRARYLPDGAIELLGRDSLSVNSGGEKIFVEEVEAAITGHPDVVDVVVVGRPSERWGQEVCAIVELRPNAVATENDLVAFAARSISRFKLPKSVLFVDHVHRSPSCKADYSWAKEIATSQVD
jgi:3-oxocholest-4-en-26-oate---CoA ligase